MELDGTGLMVQNWKAEKLKIYVSLYSYKQQ